MRNFFMTKNCSRITATTRSHLEGRHCLGWKILLKSIINHSIPPKQTLLKENSKILLGFINPFFFLINDTQGHRNIKISLNKLIFIQNLELTSNFTVVPQTDKLYFVEIFCTGFLRFNKLKKSVL